MTGATAYNKEISGTVYRRSGAFLLPYRFLRVKKGNNENSGDKNLFPVVTYNEKKKTGERKYEKVLYQFFDRAA